MPELQALHHCLNRKFIVWFEDPDKPRYWVTYWVTY